MTREPTPTVIGLAGTQRSVVIADDHAIARTGLRAVLESLPGTRVVAEASDGIEAIALARRHRPDLVTLDAAMDHADGMEAFGEIRRWAPATRICLVTGFTSRGIAAQWIAAGVDGYLLKGCSTEEMTRCFSVVLEGGRYVAAAVEAGLAIEDAATDEAAGLTRRERQILHMIAAGHSNAAIADRLAISARTAENHRARMMAKLGVRSLAQLIAYALREGLIDPQAQRSDGDVG